MAKKEKKRVKQISRQHSGISLLKYTLLAALFLSPLLRGLFFEKQFFVIAFVIALLALWYIWTSQGGSLDKLDILFLALAGSYALSMINAASPRLNVLSILRYLLYFLCFYLVRNSLVNYKDKKYLAVCFVSSLSLASLLTILTKAKALNLINTVIADRFAGTVEYSNAFAVLLVAALVLLFTWDNSETNLSRFNWVNILAYLNATALFATLSRGGVLIYVFILTIIFILSKVKKVLLSNLLIINILAAVSSALILRYDSIVIIAVVLFGGGLASTLQSVVLKLPVKIQGICAAAIGLVCVALLALNLDKIPLTRLLELDFSSTGFYLRYTFYKDALKIFLDNWLIGAGGAGWEILYGQYQSFYYTSKLVHSSLIQTMVEVGLIGTILFLGLIIVSGIKFIRRTEKILLNWAFLLVFMTIFLHSLIDFDLSIPAVPLLMFAAMGVMAGPSDTLIQGKRIKIGIALIAFFVMVSTAAMGIAAASVNSVLQDGTITDLNAFKKNVTIAAKLDPWNKDYPTYLGQAYLTEAEQSTNTNLFEQALTHYNRAIELEPQNYLPYMAHGMALQKMGRFDEAAAAYEQVIQLRPFHSLGYEYAMKNFYEQFEKTADTAAVQNILRTYDQAVQQMAQVTGTELQYVEEKFRLDKSSVINEYAELARVRLAESSR